MDGDRISPVLDVARTFVLMTSSLDGAVIRKEVFITDEERLRQVSGEHVVPGLAGAVFRFGVVSALQSRETS